MPPKSHVFLKSVVVFTRMYLDSDCTGSIVSEKFVISDLLFVLGVSLFLVFCSLALVFSFGHSYSP